MAQRRKLPPIHPGELLRDELGEIGVSLNELARALRVPMNRISAIAVSYTHLDVYKRQASNGSQIGETRGGVQPAQPLACLLFDPAKLPAAKSLVDRLGFRASERADHTR